MARVAETTAPPSADRVLAALVTLPAVAPLDSLAEALELGCDLEALADLLSDLEAGGLVRVWDGGEEGLGVVLSPLAAEKLGVMLSADSSHWLRPGQFPHDRELPRFATETDASSPDSDGHLLNGHADHGVVDALDAMLKAELGLTQEEARYAKVQQQAAIAEMAEPLLKDEELKAVRAAGGSSGGRGRKKPSSSDNEGLRGASSGYLAARIARDFPEILNRMKAGEFTSVRKAALEAGFIPPTVTIPIVPWRAARLLRKHFTGALWPALMDAIEATSTPDAGEEVS